MGWKFKKIMKMEFVPLMKFLIEMYEPDIYVEIGIQHGETFNEISPLIKESHGVDINPMPRVKYNDNVHLHANGVVEFANNWDINKQIDLLFIDGDHKKESVLRDFDLLSPFVSPQTGLILLHDAYPSEPYLIKPGWCHNAWEAARTIHTNHLYKDWEIITLPGPYAGLSIIRNATNHLHWMK